MPIEKIIFIVVVCVAYFTSQLVIAIYEQKPEYFLGGGLTAGLLAAVLSCYPFQAEYLAMLFCLLGCIFLRGIFTKFE